jgi:hypothetical protein
LEGLDGFDGLDGTKAMWGVQILLFFPALANDWATVNLTVLKKNGLERQKQPIPTRSQIK